MNTWLDRQRVAGWLGLVGGGLGVVAGLIQATVGDRIPSWSGSKANPVALGLLTITLSLVALLSAVVLRRYPGLPPARRIAAVVGLLVPAALCFSTVGRLWYLPGLVLLAAAVYATLAGDLAHTRDLVTTQWLHVLVSLLGALELLMAVSSGPVLTIAVGVVGGLALVAAPWIWATAVRIALLLIGTLPFAVITWWSVASPLLAITALGIGFTMRATPRPARPLIMASRA